MSDPIIKIQNMNKWFGDFQVLKNINLEDSTQSGKYITRLKRDEYARLTKSTIYH